MNDYKKSEKVEKELKLKQEKEAKTTEEAKKAAEEIPKAKKTVEEKTKAASEQRKESQSTLDAAAEVKKSLQLQHKNAATAAEKEHAEHLIKKIEAKQEKENEAIRRKEMEVTNAKNNELAATVKATQLNKTAEAEKKANLAAKKEIEEAKIAAEKVAKEEVEKQESLKKLQEKNEQDGEDAYKKLLDSVPKGSSLAEQSEQTPDHVYELAASIIEQNPKYGVAEASMIGQDELVARHEVIRIDKNITAEAVPTKSVKAKVQAAVKNVSEKAAPATAKSADSADDFDNI